MAAEKGVEKERVYFRGLANISYGLTDELKRMREKSTSGGVLKQYVGATPLGAGIIPAAIERNYPKRLLKAGWWHMSLVHQPANTFE